MDLRAALALALVACSGGDGGAVDACRGAWHVCDGHIRDADGRAVVLFGANVAGAHKNAPYLAWHTAADFARMRDEWGMNSVRFLTTWAAVEPEMGQYDDAYLDAVAERLAWIRDAGMVAVLDMHQDVYGEGFGFDGAPRWTCDQAHYDAFVPVTGPWFLNYQNEHVLACVDGFYQSEDLQARFAAAWRHVAARFAGEPAVIGFDPLNEPHWGTYGISQFEEDRLAPMVERVTAEVRAEAPGWLAFVEPSAARNGGFPTNLAPFSFADVVYAPHSYDMNAEAGMGFDETHRDAVFGHVALARDEAERLGAALWLGEYGGDAGDPSITPYMDAELDAAGVEAAGQAYWSYDKGGVYSMLDADGLEKPALFAELVRPRPGRVAGAPLDWTWDETTSTFTLRFTSDPSVTLPTELLVPPRVYPAGYDVDCGGCATETAPGALLLLTPPPGDPAIVTLTPAP